MRPEAPIIFYSEEAIRGWQLQPGVTGLTIELDPAGTLDEAHQQRSELAHASHLAVVGELSASIAHQINH